MQLDLGDLAAGLGFRSDELTPFATEPGSIALQRGHPVIGNEMFFPKIEDALQFLLNQSDFLRPWLQSAR